MGFADVVTKAYIRKNKVFADAFNYFMFDGDQKIQPEQLRELDTTEIAIFLNEKANRNKKNERMSELKNVQKYRDLFKSAVIMEDGEAAYILLGIENQTDVHYAMPVKNMLYDAIQYNQQVLDIAVKHREQRKHNDYRRRNISNGEFLSGFHKEDKLIPIITLVLFFNAGEWDGPRSLLDMMEITNPAIKRWVVDYPLYLIDPRNISDENLMKFNSSLREVIGCIKYSNDKEKLTAFIQDNPRMNMEIEAARVIEAITNMEIESEEVDSMGNVNMCKALQDIMQDSRNEGINEGVDIGLIRGKLQVLSTLIQSGKVTVKEAAAIMDMTPEEFITKSKSIS